MGLFLGPAFLTFPAQTPLSQLDHSNGKISLFNLHEGMAQKIRDSIMKAMFFHFLFTSFSLFIPFTKVASADYIIYSVVQDLPMGEPGEIVKKNYYLNIGRKQGVEKGTVLDVVRQISRQDPYETKKRFLYNVDIGKLKVIHSEEDGSIAIVQHIYDSEDSPLYEIDNFMVGDRVQVDVN